ncbi:MAG: glutathione S-transferase family protein, partial [Micavibrio sp.]|nr:glutathione S-transferase family protein [Micavibrio sp.]
NMSLTLHKFGSQWGIADPSAFCVKLESFLRLNKIAHTIGDRDMQTLLSKAPKKKVPYIEFENGEHMGDSNLIIEHLSAEYNIDMEKDLTDAQRAQSHAFRRMLDEGFYFSALYSRWVDDTGWNVISPLFFSNMPPIIGDFIVKKIRKDVMQKTYDQGTGRHSKEDVYAMGNRDLDALSALLGKDEWFFGAKQPSLLDISAHAFVINIIAAPIDNAMKAHCEKLKNLCDHAQRFETLTYKN